MGELTQLVSDVVSPFPAYQLGIVQPAIQPRVGRHPEQRRLYFERRQAPRLVPLVQRADVTGQPAVPVDEPPVQVADVGLGHMLGVRHRVAELVRDAHPVPGALVDVEYDLAEAHALEPG